MKKIYKNKMLRVVMALTFFMFNVNGLNAKLLVVEDGGGGSGGDPTTIQQVMENLQAIQQAQEIYAGSHGGNYFQSGDLFAINQNLGLSIPSSSVSYRTYDDPSVAAEAMNTSSDLMYYSVDRTGQIHCLAGSACSGSQEQQPQQSRPDGLQSPTATCTPWLTGGTIKMSAAMADLNNAAEYPGKEVVVGSNDGKIYVWKSDGSPYYPDSTNCYFRATSVSSSAFETSSAAVADLTGDGNNEIALGANDLRLYVLKTNSTNWEDVDYLNEGATDPWPKILGGAIRSAPVIENIDADADLEIIVSAWNGKVYAFNHDGTGVTALWGNGFKPDAFINAMRSSPAIGDLLNNGQKTIVVGSYATTGNPNRIYKLGTNATVIASKDVAGNVFASPILADIDGDGAFEIIVSSKDDMDVNVTRLYVLKADLSDVPGWEGGKIVQGKTALSSPTVANFAGVGDIVYNQDLEILVTTETGKVYAFHDDGSDVASWTAGKTVSPVIVESSPTVGDVDGDSDMEIITASRNSINTIGNMHILHHDSTATTSINTGSVSYSSATLGDLTGDNLLDIILGTDTNSLFVRNQGTYDPTKIKWAKFRGDLRNTGVYNREDRQPPVVLPIDNQSIEVGQNLTFPVTASDNNSMLAIRMSGDTLPGPGTKFTYTSGNSGTFSWTPQSGDQGLYDIYFVATDYYGLHSACEFNTAAPACDHVTITVSGPTNSPPVANDDNPPAINEDTAGVFDVLANDTDPNGLNDIDKSSVTITVPPTKGAITNINATTGVVTYQPNANVNGTDTFEYKIKDMAGVWSVNDALVTVTITPVNDAPVADDETYPATEDIALNVSTASAGLLSGDTDVDGDPLTLVSCSSIPANQGALTCNADGTFLYTPFLNFNGSVNFTYIVKDNQTPALTDTGAVTINVAPVNDAPVADDETYPATEDIALNVSTASSGLLDGDTDVDGNPLTLVSCSPIPANQGTLTCNADGTFLYTPFLNFNGPVNFTYIVRDNGTPALTDVGAVTINVAPVNDAPTAVNDSYSTPMNTDLVVPVPGVLNNDSDLEGSALTANRTGATGPNNGTLVAFNSNGSFTYRPNAGFVGSDSFTYRANDGSLNSNYATVTINVSNTAPVLSPLPDIQTDEDVPLNNAIDLYSYAFDAETPDSGLFFNIVSSTNPQAGVTIDTNRYIDVNPAANWSGASTVTIQVTDPGGLWAQDPFVVTVNGGNDAPVADDEIYATNEDTALNVSTASNGLLAGDTDPDPGDTLSLVSCSSIPANQGTLTCNPDGTFLYTPFLNFNGPVNFTYVVTDNGTIPLTDTGAVTINVAPINDAPVADDEIYATNEDIVLNVSTASSGLLAGDTDVDGNPLTLVSCSSIPANQGTLTCNADGTFVYTPFLNFNGPVNFTYTVGDNGTPVLTDVGAVRIDVAPINDAPVADDEIYATNEDTALNVSTASSGLLAGDTDVDGNPLTLVSCSPIPANQGTLTCNADGTFLYTPFLNFNGPVNFTYTVGDNGTPVLTDVGAVRIDVAPINDAPTVVNDGYSTPINTDLVVPVPGVLNNDSDVEGSALTANRTGATGPNNGTLVAFNSNGSFTYRPNTGFVGSDSFTYRANDGSLNSNFATVNISVSNTAPVLSPLPDIQTDEDASLNNAIDLYSYAFDAETPDSGLFFNIVSSTNPQAGVTIDSNRYIDVSPAANWNGASTVTVQVTDPGGLWAQDPFIVTVRPINDAPVADDEIYATNEDIVLNVSTASSGLLAGDTDVDGNPLTLVSCSSIPANQGTLTCNADGTFVYTPFLNFNGPVNFTYTVGDNGTPVLTDVGAVRIDVAPINDAPVAVDDAYPAVRNTPLVVAAPGVLSNDTDVENNTLTAAKLSNPTNGSVVLNTNGSFTYTPNTNYLGPDSFTYKANDGFADSNAATVNITVTGGAQQPPVAVNDSYPTNEDTVLIVPAPGVLSNDTDVNGDALTAIKVSEPNKGTVVLNPNGSFTYTPNANENGSDSFTYKANDGTADSNIATVTINITPVNDVPVAVDDSYSTGQGTTLTVPAPGILSNDTDADNDPLTVYQIVSNPTNGVLTPNSNGSFVYVPNAGYSGADSFTYKATDGIAPSNTATVNITIAGNQPPVAVNDAYATDEDVVLNVPAPGVLTNDTDPEGNALTSIKVSDPTKGTVILSTNGSFTYTPFPNVTGTDSFTYKARDGVSDSNIATVTINITPVGDDPIMDPLSNVVKNENEMVSFVVKAYDPDGDQVRITVTGNPAGSYLGATTWVPGDNRWEATFTWQTGYNDSGLYYPVTFLADEYTPPPPPVGGGGCFLAGTMVTMADGSQKPIEKIELGDIVLAYDEASKQMKPDKVTHVFNHPKEDVYLIVNNHLKVTPIHRVLSKGKWVNIGKLKIGDTLTNTAGEDIAITSIKKIKESVNIYNFEVNPFHTYVADGFVVHNRKLPSNIP